jgi:hypothetical protein
MVFVSSSVLLVLDGTVDHLVSSSVLLVLDGTVVYLYSSSFLLVLDGTVLYLHRGADPCRLRAHHTDYADFSNPSGPQKINFRFLIQRDGGIWKEPVQLGEKGGIFNV